MSFLWVALSFAIYSVCIVPFIERDHGAQPNTNTGVVHAQSNATHRFVRELTPYFPEGSWELENPRVLRNDRATLLLQEFTQRDDGSLHIQPCTLVFYDGGRDNLEHGPTILQAPEGAILSFDELDLSGGVFGNPVGGSLVGEIRIFRAGGPTAKDLEIRTSNVQISNRRLWTPDRVIMRLGNSFAVGSYLMLTLREDASRSQPHSWIDGLGIAELERLERLSFRLSDGEMFSAFGGQSDGQPGAGQRPNSRYEVRCDGPLKFDLHHMVATVEDNVTIARQTPGQTDTLRCSQLSMHLARTQTTAANQDKAESTLTLTHVIAVGEPLVVDAPSEAAYVETRRLDYDFDSRQVKLRAAPSATAEDGSVLPDSPRVVLRNADHEIVCPAIDFSGSQDRSTWTMVAAGPGQYTGTAAKKSGEVVSATWEQSLSLQPARGKQLLKIAGNTAVWSPGLGTVQADIIDVELQHRRKLIATKLDGTPVYETTTEPTKLVTYSARGTRTVIESPTLNGSLAKLTVLFDHAPAQPQSPEGNVASGVPSRRSTSPQTLESSQELRYQLEGGEVTAWVRGAGQQLERLVVTGQSRVVAESVQGERPFDVSGTAIDVKMSDLGRPLARLRGNPAVLKTSSMYLSGSDIQLDGDRNRVDILGPGTLRAPLDAQAFGTHETDRKKADIGEIEVAWQGGLQFDGQVAQVTEKVVASGTDLRIHTSDLEVTLDRPIDLANFGPSTSKPNVARVSATGGVSAMSQNRDEAGAVASRQHLVTRDFSLDVQSGEALAHGPGWLAMTSPAENYQAVSAARSDSTKQGLQQLSVAFAQQLTGNIHQRQATIEDDIQAWFGPVDSWEQRVDPRQAGDLVDDAFLLSCREVQIAESPTAPTVGSRKPFELLATGETLVESSRYAALGRQLKYSEEKGMLTLEGDDQRPAELWQRNPADGTTSHTGQMSRIRYWTESGEIAFSRLRLDLSALPAN